MPETLSSAAEVVRLLAIEMHIHSELKKEPGLQNVVRAALQTWFCAAGAQDRMRTGSAQAVLLKYDIQGFHYLQNLVHNGCGGEILEGILQNVPDLYAFTIIRGGNPEALPALRDHLRMRLGEIPMLHDQAPEPLDAEGEAWCRELLSELMDEKLDFADFYRRHDMDCLRWPLVFPDRETMQAFRQAYPNSGDWTVPGPDERTVWPVKILAGEIP